MEPTPTPKLVREWWYYNECTGGVSRCVAHKDGPGVKLEGHRFATQEEAEAYQHDREIEIAEELLALEPGQRPSLRLRYAIRLRPGLTGGSTVSERDD